MGETPTISYRPGWSFRWEGDWLHATVVRPNATRPGESQEAEYAFRPSRFSGGWLRNRLLGIESHEVDEWLRIDGELVHDPHGVEAEAVDQAEVGVAALMGAIRDIRPEGRLDAVALFIRACLDTRYFTKPGFELPRAGGEGQ